MGFYCLWKVQTSPCQTYTLCTLVSASNASIVMLQHNLKQAVSGPNDVCELFVLIPPRDAQTRVRYARLRFPCASGARTYGSDPGKRRPARRLRDVHIGEHGRGPSTTLVLSACARPRLRDGPPCLRGLLRCHGAIGLPHAPPVRGYGHTDAVRRAASAAWSRATFFVLAFQATSKRSPTTGSAPTTVSRPMLAAMRRSTRPWRA